MNDLDREPPIPPMPDRPTEPPVSSIEPGGVIWREEGESDVAFARRCEATDAPKPDEFGRYLPPMAPVDVAAISKRMDALPKGCVVTQSYVDGSTKIFVPAEDYDAAVAKQAQPFTTQRIPYFVHNALQKVIREIGMALEVKGAFPVHMAVMVHPNDWRWYLEFMRQQGTLDESKGPINVGSVELSGATVLQDLGGKVPHLNLVVE